jgi:hypothetical protein
MTDKQYKAIVSKLNLLQATMEALARRSIQEHPVPSHDAIPSEHLSSFADVRKEILAGIQESDKTAGY